MAEGGPTSVPVLLRAARLFDGTGAPPVDNAAVLVSETRILSVFIGPVAEDGLPPGTRVLDFPTGTLMPGLIDSHVHLNLPADGTPYLDTVAEGDGVLVANATHNARLALEAGITTLRDTGGRGSTTIELRRALSLGYCVGPTLLVCGQPITITGGHTWQFGGEADGAEGVRAKARQMARLGADFIKVMGSGGGTPGTTSWLPSYTREELAAVADEAHRLGRKVTVHCLCGDSIDCAVDAGVDQIEHAGFLIDAEGRQRFDPVVAEKLARAHIPVTSTLAVGEYILEALRGRDRPTSGEAEYRDFWERMREDNMSQLRALHRAGVPLIAGTDAGWRYTAWDALHGEIRWLHDVGLSSREALAAATGTAAGVLGLGERLGTVREGLAADLIVVDGDPVQDLGALRRLKLVMHNGTLHPLPQATALQPLPA